MRAFCRYNICAFSRLDSQLLVLKAAQGPPAVALLDPRGVFVVQGAQKFFVWAGAASAKEHRKAGESLVAKLLKYELGGGAGWPIEEIAQGEETREFLALLGVPAENYRSLKKLPEVEAYDKDYSAIYQSPSGHLF